MTIISLNVFVRSKK